MFGVLMFMCGGGLCGVIAPSLVSDTDYTECSVSEGVRGAPRSGLAERGRGPVSTAHLATSTPLDSEAWSEWCRLSVHSAVTDGDVGWLFA
jgi:hypothetical protein